MTPNEIRAAIWSHVHENWDATTAPVRYQGLEHVFVQPTASAWLDLHILPGQTFEEEKDMGLGRRVGVVMARIFVPLTNNASTAWTLAGQVESLFRRLTIGGVAFSEPRTEVGNFEPGWQQFNIYVPFWAWVGE